MRERQMINFRFSGCEHFETAISRPTSWKILNGMDRKKTENGICSSVGNTFIHSSVINRIKVAYSLIYQYLI